MCTGKADVGTCGDIGEQGTQTEAVKLGYSVVIPAEPVLKSTYTADDVACVLGTSAIALNGVAFFSGAINEQCGQLGGCTWPRRQGSRPERAS